MNENLPRKITFEEIQVGDTIRAEWANLGVSITYQGVVSRITSKHAATEERSILVFRDDNNITLLDRLAPPRMDEPTRIGSVVVAGGPGSRCFIIRVGAFSPGPWHWRYSEIEKLCRWDDLTNPRPATEREIEEGRVIEP